MTKHAPRRQKCMMNTRHTLCQRFSNRLPHNTVYCRRNWIAYIIVTPKFLQFKFSLLIHSKGCSLRLTTCRRLRVKTTSRRGRWNNGPNGKAWHWRSKGRADQLVPHAFNKLSCLYVTFCTCLPSDLFVDVHTSLLILGNMYTADSWKHRHDFLLCSL